MARVAVVNHDAEFLDLMREVLSVEGHDVLTLPYDGEVFTRLRAGHPDLIVLDIRVSRGEDGWTLCDKLTLHPDTTNIPILVCSTALAELREQRDWLKRKGIGVLPKPFDLDDLYGCIDSMLRSDEPCMIGLDQAS